MDNLNGQIVVFNFSSNFSNLKSLCYVCFSIDEDQLNAWHLIKYLPLDYGALSCGGAEDAYYFFLLRFLPPIFSKY